MFDYNAYFHTNRMLWSTLGKDQGELSMTELCPVVVLGSLAFV